MAKWGLYYKGIEALFPEEWNALVDALEELDSRAPLELNGGVIELTGDGSTIQFKISHGLTDIPSFVCIGKYSSGLPDIDYWFADDLYIYVNFKSAPPAGTFRLYWLALRLLAPAPTPYIPPPPPPPPPPPVELYSPILIGFGEAGYIIDYGNISSHMPFSSSRDVTAGMPVPYNGVAKNLVIYVQSNSLNNETYIAVRKNETDTDLKVTIPAGQTGLFINNTISVNFSKGDRLSFKVDASNSTSGNMDVVGICISYYISTEGFKSIAGLGHTLWTLDYGAYEEHQVFSDATGSSKGVPLPFKCLAKNLCVYVTNNSLNGDTYIIIRKNEEDIKSLTIPAGETGLFTMDVDTLYLENDRLDFLADVYGSSGSISISGISVELIPQDTITKPIAIIGFGEAGYVIDYGAYEEHQPFSCRVGSSKGMSVPHAGTAKKMKVYVNSNSLNGTTYVRCRKNEDEGYIQVEIPAGEVGLFENNVDTLDFSVGDRIDFTIDTTASTSGNIDISAISVAYEAT